MCVFEVVAGKDVKWPKTERGGRFEVVCNRCEWRNPSYTIDETFNYLKSLVDEHIQKNPTHGVRLSYFGPGGGE